MLPLIIVHGARNEILVYVHRMLMVEAVNTTMGGIAQERHDEVLEYILQVPCPWHTLLHLILSAHPFHVSDCI